MSVDTAPPQSCDDPQGWEALAQARREDITWMADTGENVVGAAKRLGMSPKTLQSWCSTHDAHDLWARLRANAPTISAGASKGAG